MLLAFHNRYDVKRDALARLDHHAANGTLKFGATSWTGNSGSPLGVTARGTEAQDYSVKLGYPIALSAWLDALCVALSNEDDAMAFARAWINDVDPGSDLSRASLAILTELLSTSGAVETWPDLAEKIAILHENELDGDLPARADWSQVRRQLAALRDIETDPRQKLLIATCEAACWPLTTSQSVLSEVGRLWMQLAACENNPDWSTEDAANFQTTMKRLGEEYRREHGADADPNFPALLSVADPVLERRFRAHLGWQQQQYQMRARALATMVLAALANQNLEARNSASRSSEESTA